jgi:beta-mannosidase
MLQTVSGVVRVDLGGVWSVRREGAEETLPAQVPGCIHTDLLAAGTIEDPYYRDNEDRVQWVSDATWVYTRTFTASEALLAHDTLLLRCEGLDTLATVTLNGVELGRTDNMYRTWEFDVRGALQAGANTLTVTFAPPRPYLEARLAAQAVHGWHGPKEVPGRSYLRKEPCNFGWDWGPVLVTCGIWRPISLIAYREARLTDLYVAQHHRDGAVTLDVTATVTHTVPVAARVTVALDGVPVAQAAAPVVDDTARATLDIPDPQLWWPNTLGAQPLYTVTVEATAGDAVLDTATRRVGLRTLRLDRHPDQWGESFQFVVNGVPFFAKGANWIPTDTFATRITAETYHDILASARDANMNMLRVWGGGIYEADVFYDLCDEMGLTVWQDFMFACSGYPAFDPAFMANAEAEFRDNVARLRHHPCIALWCGNNELEMGLVGDGDGKMSWPDYKSLFDALIPRVVRELDPERDYWPCSPHSPVGDRHDFNNPACGDAHLWDVWHGKKPFEWYRTCEHRFNSEFGFQSFPEPRVVHGYTAPDDRNVTTYVMEHHQRSGIGNSTIMTYLLDWYRLPTSFDMTLWLSQILQGMAIKYAVEHWRRAMPRGMGTLYWQLNDCWPVASWASLDYFGHWKALHYMARHFYAPVLVSMVEDLEAGTVALHVTNDHRTPVHGTVVWTVTDLAGTPLLRGTLPVEAAPLANTPAGTVDVTPALQAHGPRGLLVWAELVVDGVRVSDNIALFARPKHLALRDPGLMADVRDAGDGRFDITLSARYPALWTWVELTDTETRCSDNFVHIRPGAPVTITLTPRTPLTLDAVQAQLVVRSLVDTYA